jgi:thiol peroxidase
MTVEQKGKFRFQNQDVTIIGRDLKAGEKAPDFVAQNMDWQIIRPLEQTEGKVRIIGPLPSLSTSVCDREARRFNQEAVSLGEDIVIFMVSMDVPFTLKSWCGMAGIDRVIPLSDHLTGEFGEKYGVLIKEARLFRRAIFVVDRQGTIAYAAYMPVLGEEPNYEAVLEYARKAL